MKLGNTVSGMFKTYLKKPLLFSGIHLAISVPLLILEMVILTGSFFLLFGAIMTGDVAAIFSVGGILALIFLVISVIAGALILGGLIRATDKVYSGEKVSLVECLSYAFSKVWAYVVLGLRVFWYSLAWVLILAMIILPILMTVFTAGPGGQATAFPETAYAQVIQPGDQPLDIVDALPEDFDFDIEGLEELQKELEAELEGLPGDFDFDFESGFSGDMTSYLSPFAVYGPILSIIFLVLLVLVIYRSLKAALSFYILFDEEKIGTKQALDKSIALMKGNLWRFIGYWIVLVVILAVFGIAYQFVSNIVMSVLDYSIVASILLLIYNAIVAPLTIIFVFLFYKGLRKEKHA